MITSYAHHGKGLEALQLFDLMKKSGIEPDDVTFVGVLSACSHTGLVGEGYFHLNSMIRDYGIEPGYKHYTCMVDLLGRAGSLEEAHSFIVNMPIEPNTLVWETLLAACKVHGNHELGKLAVEKIKELQPSGAGAYVSVSNIWAEAGEWEHVLKIRGSMKETGIFEAFGPVELVQLPTDPETGGHCEGFGFVQFAQLEHANAAQVYMRNWRLLVGPLRFPLLLIMLEYKIQEQKLQILRMMMGVVWAVSASLQNV
ncbi:Pentatricopeptide repeat-containing protein [Sesamum angolense]|uniref:Pentatricopeptide repeat-containing protein n=1 Tax=Sesamum angolense TaxID=2727404 RepID=A0AAE1XGM6_9LAMI|nr:Pentatricopeptide repeat-containing protein [Sesamum angolense]